MADIFDFGVDFGLSFFEPLPERRQRTGTLTREEYGKQDVDFYEQSLDDSLGTGIELRFKDKDKEEDKKEDINVNVVGDDGGETTYDIQDTGQIGLGAGEQIGIGNTTSALGSINVGTYGQSLSQAGLGDKNPFSAFGLDIYTASVPTTKDEAKKGLSKQFSKEKLTQSGIKFAGRMLGIPSPLTSGVMGFANGVTVSDPLGNPSFRPSHAVFGLAHDINMSIQYSNASAISAAINANLDVPYAERGPIGFMGYDPTNGQLISRAPLGKTWTGTTSLSIQQLSALEALARGYTPSSYNNQTERGESLSASTGAFSGYDDRGFHHTINGVSPTGLMSHATTAAKGRQITLSQMLNNLKTARKNTTFFGKIKDPNKTLTKLNQKSFRDNVTSGQFGGVDSLSVQQQTDIQNALESGKGVNEYGGISAKGLTDVQGISQATQGITSGSFGKVSIESPGDNSNDGGSGSGSGAAGSGSDSGPGGGVGGDATGGYTAFGGQIGKGMQEGGPAGFIGGPPEKYSDQTTIADDIPLQVKEGSFVINAPAVEYAGSDDIADMLRKAYEKAGESIDKSGQTTTIPSREQIDIMISRGEVVVPPKIAKIIGYDRLEKINNRGKKEVARRKKAGDQERPQARQANQGGFIEKAEGDKVTVYRGEPSKFPKRAELLRDKYTGSWFSPNKNFTKTYGEVAKTMELTFDEYKKGAKKAFLKKNISTRRMENRDAKLPPDLTRSQRSRIFQSLKYIDFMANEVKKGNRSTKAFADFMYEGVFPKEKDKATIMLLETAKRSPKAFGKLVVDSLVKNVVSKGIPIVGAVAGFAPKEMGDATLSGKEGFIYDYRTVNKD
jgi:hypothetical protein